MNDLTHLSLFTGIGGIDLAAEWAGFRTIGQVEQNSYALRVLRKRFGRTLPRWTDIRDLSADDVRRRTGIDCPTLISGGFPCQPFSCAGKRRGKEDDRYLWPEMFRILRELRPAWVLGENVAGIVNMELESCCADLEGEGYTVRTFLIPACGVGAPFIGYRSFIVATIRDEPGKPRDGEIGRMGGIGESPPWDRDWESALCDLRRMDDGLSYGVERTDVIRAAVVPQQVYPILAGIAQVEQEINKG